MIKFVVVTLCVTTTSALNLSKNIGGVLDDEWLYTKAEKAWHALYEDDSLLEAFVALDENEKGDSYTDISYSETYANQFLGYLNAERKIANVDLIESRLVVTHMN